MGKSTSSLNARNLLVHGYIRNFTKSFDIIVPCSINNICITYYYGDQKVYFLCSNKEANDCELYVYDIIDINNLKKKTNCHIYHLNDMDTKIDASKYNWSAYCIGRNVLFPKYIGNKLKGELNDVVIFQCGGYDAINGRYINDCSAIITSHERNKSYNIQLPSFPVNQNHSYDYNGPNTFYDSEKGLFSIGGLNQSFLFQLEFNNIENDHDWKWNRLPGLRVHRQWPSCVMIDTNEIENRKKVLAVAGYYGSYYRYVELFDFKKNEWSSVQSTNVKREKCGIYYDRQKQNVYIGGGYPQPAPTSIECYDIAKDKWIPIKSTNREHTYFPVMTINDNILYIASNMTGQNVEFLDLRTSKWNFTSLSLPNHTDVSSRLFNAKM